MSGQRARRVRVKPGTVERLYAALIQPSRPLYESVRSDLIDAYGYDRFRDLQREAFKRIHKPAVVVS